MVGITALWCYRYLDGRLQTLDREIENASLELLNHLSRFRGGFPAERPVRQISDGRMFGEKPLAELSRDEKFRRHCMFLTGAVLVTAWFAQVLRYFGHDSLHLYSSVQAALAHVPLMFVVSCLAVYPVWTRILHRRSGGLMALGSLFCCCWSLVELVFGVSLP